MNKINQKILTACVAVGSVAILMLLSVPAVAKDPTHPVLRNYIDSGEGTVEALGRAFGMDGWLVTNAQGGTQYAYTNDEGALLIGLLFDNAGDMVVYDEDAEESTSAGAVTDDPQAARPSATSAAEVFYTNVQHLSWVEVGDKTAPYIYVIVNTNCDSCETYWEALQEPILSKELRVRLIPVGADEKDRFGAAALLDAANVESLKVQSSQEPSSESLQAVDRATQVWQEAKLPGPPFTIYRKPATGELVAIPGVPENMLRLRADMIR